MKQTPAHDHHNPDVLTFLPEASETIVEVGCSTGALAKAYKKINPGCRYVGIEIDSEYAELARRYCDAVINADIENAAEDVLQPLASTDCWVFSDTLEHLRDPWAVLKRLRSLIADSACVVACIPNVQHWSIQAKLCRGEFRYEEIGLMDRTHLRWFTRITIIDLFHSAGFNIIEGGPRVFEEAGRDAVLPAIRSMALAVGADPEMAVADATAFQYVVKAVPA